MRVQSADNILIASLGQYQTHKLPERGLNVCCKTFRFPWHVKNTFERADQSSPRPDLSKITCHSTTILIVLASISDYVLRRYLSVRQCAQAGTQTYACRTPPELQRRETHEISFLLSCAGQQIDERLSSAKVAPLTCTELALPDHSCLQLVKLLLPPPQH